MIEDLKDLDTVEIKVAKVGNTYRIWVNGPNGLLFRAYNVKTLQLDISPGVLLAELTKPE